MVPALKPVKVVPVITPTAVLDEIQGKAVAAVAHRLGIVSPLGNDASIALGTSEVTPLELTSAFVPFSNGGYPVTAYAVTRILTRDGKVVYERTAPVSPKPSATMTSGA